MSFLDDIAGARGNPELLERLYQAARKANRAREFTADLVACYQQAPDNLLYAAWYHRLQPRPAALAEAAGIRWLLAVPLGLVVGLIFYVMTRPSFPRLPYDAPYLVFLGGPILAAAVIAFLTLAGARRQKPALAMILGLAAISAYAVTLASPARREPYAIISALHLPVLAWAAVGLIALRLRWDPHEVAAVLLKSIEVVIVAGIYGLAGALFAGITAGLFQALDVEIPRSIAEFLITVGAGAVPLLALASVYDPRLRPAEQRFEQGLGRLLPTLTRLLLPLALVVLLIYLCVIPFNFMGPFRNRELLIIYNVLLFAVMALLVGATPLLPDDLPPRQQALLRTGILALAGLTVLVSLYALSATVYRTVLGGITINRLTVIGWNSINIALLVLLAYRQLRRGLAEWLPSLHGVFSLGAKAYIVWATFLLLAIPWLFG